MTIKFGECNLCDSLLTVEDANFEAIGLPLKNTLLFIPYCSLFISRFFLVNYI